MTFVMIQNDYCFCFFLNIGVRIHFNPHTNRGPFVSVPALWGINLCVLFAMAFLISARLIPFHPNPPVDIHIQTVCHMNPFGFWTFGLKQQPFFFQHLNLGAAKKMEVEI